MESSSSAGFLALPNEINECIFIEERNMAAVFCTSKSINELIAKICKERLRFIKITWECRENSIVRFCFASESDYIRGIVSGKEMGSITGAMMERVKHMPLAQENKTIAYFGDHKNFILAAVTQDSRALEYASGELQNDKDVALAAVTQNGRVLEYVSGKLQQDPAIIAAMNAAKAEGR